jgi:hypothetical protein
MDEKALIAYLAGPFLMLWFGQFLHLAQIMRGKQARGEDARLWTFVRCNAWAILYTVVAGLVCYALAAAMGQLNALSALGIGFASDSVVNGFIDRSNAKLARELPQDEHGAPSA